MFLFEAHLRLDREDAAGLEGRRLQPARIVNLESDVVAYAVGLLVRAEALHHRGRRSLDPIVGEAIRRHDRVHLLHRSHE